METNNSMNSKLPGMSRNNVTQYLANTRTELNKIREQSLKMTNALAASTNNRNKEGLQTAIDELQLIIDNLKMTVIPKIEMATNRFTREEEIASMNASMKAQQSNGANAAGANNGQLPENAMGGGAKRTTKKRAIKKRTTKKRTTKKRTTKKRTTKRLSSKKTTTKRKTTKRA